ncbi:MAG TPA: ABC transporter permease [Thermoleophilaceae bacterium]|nr:ABC transporter permease [Thermoleophilaceae bacterium]
MSARSRSVALAVGWRGLHRFFRDPTMVVPSMLFPLFFFGAFAGGLSAVSDVPGFDFPENYTTFQFVFVLIQASAFGGVFTGFAIARDFEGGVGRRMMLAAPNRRALLAGYALVAAGRALFIWVMLTALALAVGMEVGGGVADLAGMYTLALLMNLTALMWAAGIALRFRSLQAGPLMQTPVFLIVFIAPVYVPFDLLTGWVKTAASVNPITAVIEAARDFVSGASADVALAYGAAAGMLVFFGIWALRGLAKAEAAGG